MSHSLKFKQELFHSSPIYIGIPSPNDFIHYNQLYYGSVFKITKEFYGDQATLENAVDVMNLHGNLVYFNWFRDLYQTKKTILKKFHNPIFTPAGGNKFADYLHGLTHIRSRSSHTNLGEAMAVVDNMINNRVRYQRFMDKFKDLPLDSIDLKPKDLLVDLGRDEALNNSKQVILLDIIKETWAYQRRDMVFYKSTYLETSFKKEFPEERPSQEFLVSPVNELEQRMKHNFIRALYLEEKFKLYSRGKQYFSETPIKVSCKEAFHLVFTDSDENKFIDELYSKITDESMEIDYADSHTDKIEFALKRNTIRSLNDWLS